MGFLNRLFGGKSSGGGAVDADGLHVYVRCDRCGETLHIRANKRTDVTREYLEGSDASEMMLHKEILGSRCQNLMFVHLTLSGTFEVATARTERCTLISVAEFDAAQIVQSKLAAE